jgi:hypothetical protein
MFTQMDFMLMRMRADEINRQTERLYVPLAFSGQPGALKRAAVALREAVNGLLRPRGGLAQGGMAGK